MRPFCLSLVGATMSKFAKSHAGKLSRMPRSRHFVSRRGKDSNMTKEFCRLNPYVPNRKLKPPRMRRFEISGRGERIRTFDILVPNQALYQTELHPETKGIITAFFTNANFYFNFMLV